MYTSNPKVVIVTDILSSGGGAGTKNTTMRRTWQYHKIYTYVLEFGAIYLSCYLSKISVYSHENIN